jgi:RNA polymerase sigma-70 factor (ECF subfamily)
MMGRTTASGVMAEDQATPSPELDRQILVGCRAQDPQAFRAFVLNYQRVVFALLSRVLGHGAHVQDLAQEVFLRAYRAFPTFDLEAEARPSTWLLTITVRLALTTRKKLARFPRSEGLAAATQVAHPSTPETERARREIGRAIETAAGELSADQRAAFVLAEFHGLTIAEIARVLGTPENTVKTRLFRARAHMREHLASFEKGPIR